MVDIVLTLVLKSLYDVRKTCSVTFLLVFFGLQVTAVFSMTAELMVYPHVSVDFVDKARSAKLKLYIPTHKTSSKNSQ